MRERKYDVALIFGFELDFEFKGTSNPGKGGCSVSTVFWHLPDATKSLKVSRISQLKTKKNISSLLASTWPDVGVKNCPNISTSCLKNIHSSFYITLSFSKKPKSHQSLWTTFLRICRLLNFSKNDQSSHTGYPTTFQPFLTKTAFLKILKICPFCLA